MGVPWTPTAIRTPQTAHPGERSEPRTTHNPQLTTASASEPGTARDRRTQRAAHVLVLLLALWLATPLGAESRAGELSGGGFARHVLIVSIDGLRPELLVNRSLHVPHLHRLMSEGASTLSAWTVYPSATLPGHASMLTGTLPAIHGIRFNRRQEEWGYVRVPSILTWARKQHLRTAAFYAKRKLVHLFPPGSLSAGGHSGWTSRSVASAAAKELSVRPADLAFIHLTDVDSAGHAEGWLSRAQGRALEETDRELGRVLEAARSSGMLDGGLVLVTSDHGGAETWHGSRDETNMRIPWIAWGERVRARSRPRGSVSVCDTAATALWALGLPAPGELYGEPRREIFRR